MQFKIHEKSSFSSKLSDLKPDEIGVTETGLIYIKGFEIKTFICINNPGMSYQHGAPNSTVIKILPKGSRVEITV